MDDETLKEFVRRGRSAQAAVNEIIEAIGEDPHPKKCVLIISIPRQTAKLLADMASVSSASIDDVANCLLLHGVQKLRKEYRRSKGDVT